MDENDYKLLNALNTETKRWRAIVTVVSKSSCRLAKDNKTKYQRLVLADKEGNCVDATIYDSNIDLYKKILQQDETYIVSNAWIRKADHLYGSSLANTNFSWTINASTYVSKANCLPNNQSPLKQPIVDYEEYVRPSRRETFISTIVIIVHKKPSRETSKGDTVDEYIGIDKGFKPIIITLWNNPVSEETFSVLNSTVEKPVVALVDFKVSSFYGISLSSSTKSLILTNLDDTRFVDMKDWALANQEKIAGLTINGELQNKIFSSVSNDAIPVMSIRDIDSSLANKFVIIGEARLQKFDTDTYDDDFLYICCEKCHCKANAVPNSIFNCDKGCNNFARVAKWRYKFCLQVTDATGKLDVTVFGNYGAKIFDMTEEEFHNKYFSASKVCRERVACKLEGLIWRMRIKPSPFRDQFSYNVEEMVLHEEVIPKINQVYKRTVKRKLSFVGQVETHERADKSIFTTGITNQDELEGKKDSVDTCFPVNISVDPNIKVKVEQVEQTHKRPKEGFKFNFNSEEGSANLSAKNPTEMKDTKGKVVSIVELESDSEVLIRDLKEFCIIISTTNAIDKSKKLQEHMPLKNFVLFMLRTTGNFNMTEARNQEDVSTSSISGRRPYKRQKIIKSTSIENQSERDKLVTPHAPRGQNAASTSIRDPRANKRSIDKEIRFAHLKVIKQQVTPLKHVPDCIHCGAIRFFKEPPGFCCSSGRVSLELPKMPVQLWDLYTNQENPLAKHFRNRCRSYNNSFAFTSLGYTFDKDLCKYNRGVYTLKVQGIMRHYIGDLLPKEGPGRCLQLYFYGTENEITNRMQQIKDLDAKVISIIMDIMRCNPYNNVFRKLSNAVDLDNVTVILRADPCLDKRVYNLPVVDHVAAIWEQPIDNNDYDIRDIRVYTRSGVPQTVHYYYGCYDPLQYPLLFPYGEPGWQVGIKQLPLSGSIGSDGSTIYCTRQRQIRPQNYGTGESLIEDEHQNMEHNTRKRQNVSTREYYCYLFQIRRNDASNILRTGRLIQQYVIDCYIKIETQRLDYLREEQRQKEIRVETLQGIKDSMACDGIKDSINFGRRLILPSSFQGGPRDLRCRYMNALALVQKYGKPDFFITMTCNTKWKEIQDELLPGEEPQNRPDLLTRVFHAKNEKLKRNLIHKKKLGDVAAYFYVIEFQKRGLPHVHWLIILDNRHKLTSEEAYDTFVSAEIPDKQAYPHLYNCVAKHMMHGPCGDLNKENVCMKNRKSCKNKYPKPFSEVTAHNPNAYPIYRRRNNGRKIFTRNHELDNRWVVPYNPYLLAKFDCHLNVEICSDIKLVKYLYKYVCKGTDKINYSIVHKSDDGMTDEIKNFQSARWLCAPEAMWRIYGFMLNEIHPPVNQLHVHLPNKQPVWFPPGRNMEYVLNNPKVTKTQLTEFFNKNASDPCARSLNLLYREFPQSFVWDEKEKEWKSRQRGTIVGRLVTVNPVEGERYYLRVLLNHVRGPTSFDDLKQVNNILYETFRDAALQRGLLGSDSDLQETMQEACGYQMPNSLRRLFAIILFYNSPTDPASLWDEFKDHLSHDFLIDVGPNVEDAYRQSLQSIDTFLKYNGRSIAEYSLRLYNNWPIEEAHRDRDYMNEIQIQVSGDDMNSITQLNKCQKNAFDEIIATIGKNEGGAFFLDGPGGTGKTFLYRALLAFVRSKNQIALAVASSGVAASLLPGGRTAHNRFKFPIEVEENVSSAISKQSAEARLIIAAKLIIWDEATMANRKIIEALDELLRDLMGSQTVFGGKTIVLGGDFRQTIPVVKKGGRNESLNACLVRSHIWTMLKKLHLKENMRAREDQNFIELLMRIGNGTEPTDDRDYINLPSNMCIQNSHYDKALEQLISQIFPTYSTYSTNPYSIMDRAILTPRNDCVDDINNTLIEQFPGKMFECFSMDVTDDPSQQAQYQDFLNDISLPGLPPHKLKLKLNCPIMLLRNINAAEGMCNGTRMVVREIGNRVIGATIACGEHRGTHVLIPRIPLQAKDNKKCPIPFKRHQFPIKLCFAITINKAQGQTLDKVGIYLPQPVFSHGQLYVALSRARSTSDVKILIKPPTVDSSNYTNTKNVVYTEITDV